MERDEVGKTCAVGTSDDIDSRCAVNSLILDYYKKFGRKRDLEQFFSLSTAQSDIKDTSGLFWRKMKSENDSSDSGGRKSDSSHEVCRISIRCSLPEPSSSQEDVLKKKSESPHTVSPPIIIEEMPADESRHTDDESIDFDDKSMNFDDNNSQKSLDALLDLSAHKPLSPTSSITSQRKLEWDSLADVGYGNESDRKNSASSLSTLEKLALKQQYSNNDSNQDIGLPTSHSTPMDENDGKSKTKKGVGKKTTKIYKKDVDLVEVNVPHSSSTNAPPSINVNLTKHISFNVEKDGGISVDNVKRDVNITPDKPTQDAEVTPLVSIDKEIQTTLKRDHVEVKAQSSSSNELPTKPLQQNNQKIPVMISLNTLRKRLKKKKSRSIHRKLRTKKKREENKENTPQEKCGEQLSEAESFEYMPGHMYNQNQMKAEEQRPDNSTAGNKSSLESSGPLTTDSSKGSKHSLTKDLEKCVDLLKVTLRQRYDDGNAKKRLIKDIVNRLISSKYRDDDSTTEFLSGLSFNSVKIGLKGNSTTTSTSDANITDDNQQKKPKKSILRNEKFNPNIVASTSQSAPNLFTASSEKVNTNLVKTLNSNTESDTSSRAKTSSDNAFPKTSSEELYLKYLEALRREEAYKTHLKDKEMFLKQKLVSSETAFKVPIRQESKISCRLKDLMKDLTRNNYDDGSGDASKLEGGSTSNVDLETYNPIKSQRSHSVFTLSSSHSECLKRPNLKKKMQAERELGEAGPSRNHYCCCPHHNVDSKVGYTDSSVQVNINYQCEDVECDGKPCQPKPKECSLMPITCKKCRPASKNITRVVPDNNTGEIKYVCLCNGKAVSSTDGGENVTIYKCSKLTNRGVQLIEPLKVYNAGVQCGETHKVPKDDVQLLRAPLKSNTRTGSSSSDNTSIARRHSKSSQTNMLTSIVCNDIAEDNYLSGPEGKNLCGTSTRCILIPENAKTPVIIHEATRCLQTEISIDPKIADPKLSDINIISDCECARLVAEQLRKVYDNSSNNSEKRKTYSDVCTNSVSEKLLVPSEDSLFRDERRSGAETEDFNTPSIRRSSIKAGNSYAVPLQGTNMTLMVNLGSVGSRLNEKVDQGVTTENIDIADGATSLVEECTKSAQCSRCSAVYNSNHSCRKGSTNSTKSSSESNRFLPEFKSRSNTYPKNNQVKEKSPFKRSNTDIGRLCVCTCVQTDDIYLKEPESNSNEINTKLRNNFLTNNIISHDSAIQVDKFIETGSSKKEKSRDLIARTSSPIKELCSSCTDKREVGIQKNVSEEEQSSLERAKSSNNKVFKDSSQMTVQSVGCETEETMADKPLLRTQTDTKGNCASCQTDLPQIEYRRAGVFNRFAGGISPAQAEDQKESHSEVNSPDTNKYDTESLPKVASHKETLPKPDVQTKTTSKDATDSGDKEEVQKNTNFNAKVPTKEESRCREDCQNEPCCKSNFNENDINKDPILDLIHDITRRYSKNDVVKIKKKKCFTEIMAVLNYLLETDESTDPEPKTCCSTSTATKSSSNKSKRHKLTEGDCCDTQVDKSVQLSCRKSRKDSKMGTESSDLPCSTDMPTTSSDSNACKVLNKIRKECEKFHHKKCKSGRKCEISSSTSVGCDRCKKVHYCACKNHKCKRSKTYEKLQKKCIAYNLIIQTSESLLSEETVCEKRCRPLQNIIVKVPKRKCDSKKDGCKEQEVPNCSPRYSKSRSKSCPRESESTDDFARRTQQASVREYLEQNRPDFVAKTSQRQHCLKFISERRNQESYSPRLNMVVVHQPRCMGNAAAKPVYHGGVPICYETCDSVEPCIPYGPSDPCDPCDPCNPCVDSCNMQTLHSRLANERAAHRNLLSLHVEQQPDLTALSSDELRKLAQEIGLDLRQKKPSPKFISERDMKKHSANIYKTLPEVLRKKEEKKKANIKKTNLLMANIFKKNLQKQTLRGSVNLSNYNSVIKT